MTPYEIIARENNRGLWRGEFVLPERWRQGERLPGEPVAPPRSGPRPGERFPGLIAPKVVFDVRPPAGSVGHVNLLCRYAYEPLVLVFARDLDADLVKFLERLDAEVRRRKEQRLRVVAVFLSGRPEAVGKQVLERAANKKWSGINLAVDRPESLKSYGLGEEANVTVLFYHGVPGHGIGPTVGNHAFRQGELTAAAIGRMLADIADLCIRVDPKAEREALRALQAFNPVVARDENRAGRPVTRITFAPNRTNKPTDADLVHLKKMSLLRSLELGSNPVTDAGLAHLAGLTRLDELNLDWTKVSPAGVLALAKRHPKLRVLTVSGVPLRDDDVAALGGLTELRALSLRGARVTNNGLKHLRTLKNLRVLSLMSTRASDAALVHLNGLAQLEDLDLDQTAITDAGLQHLAGLTRLRRLQFAHTAVSDAGLEHLTCLSNLQSLNHRGTKVTKAGFEKLKKRLPKLK
jgi:hypothetical protein